MTIYSGFSHWKRWFSIINYVSLPEGTWPWFCQCCQQFFTPTIDPSWFSSPHHGPHQGSHLRSPGAGDKARCAQQQQFTKWILARVPHRRLSPLPPPSVSVQKNYPPDHHFSPSTSHQPWSNQLTINQPRHGHGLGHLPASPQTAVYLDPGSATGQGGITNSFAESTDLTARNEDPAVNGLAWRKCCRMLQKFFFELLGYTNLQDHCRVPGCRVWCNKARGISSVNG